MNVESYQIRLPQFEGPFDLLLFFIERDELDIYNIPINQIIRDFLNYIHQEGKLNIELSSEFILFVSTLMRIKARMLLPRKELDAQGNELDPRQELIDKLLEYKRYKEACVRLAELEAERIVLFRRGNQQKELSQIGEEAGEGTEIQTVSLYKLLKAFERVLQRAEKRQNRPTYTVMTYAYSMEESRDYLLNRFRHSGSEAFERIFEICENRMHAVYLFLSILELVQEAYLILIMGGGRNQFIIEFNPERMPEEIPPSSDQSP
jgi:segregation and condensation protein A